MKEKNLYKIENYMVGSSGVSKLQCKVLADLRSLDSVVKISPSPSPLLVRSQLVFTASLVVKLCTITSAKSSLGMT